MIQYYYIKLLIPPPPSIVSTKLFAFVGKIKRVPNVILCKFNTHSVIPLISPDSLNHLSNRISEMDINRVNVYSKYLIKIIIKNYS